MGGLGRRGKKNLGGCFNEFKPQSTQRTQRGPSVAGYDKKNGVGLLSQWNDYVDK